MPRLGGWREWAASRGDFEQRLARLESPAVSGAEIESETRRGSDYVRVSITAAVDAVDVAEALTAAWDVFRQAAGDDAAGWDMTAASAEVRPEAQLGARRGPRAGDGWHVPQPSRQRCCAFLSAFDTRSSIAPEMPKAPARGAAAQPHTRSFGPVRRLPSKSGSRTESQQPWPQ